MSETSLPARSTPIKAVIFDIGGVLVRTEDLGQRRAWEQRFGLPDWGLAGLVFDNPVAAQATSDTRRYASVSTHAGRSIAITPVMPLSFALPPGPQTTEHPTPPPPNFPNQPL